MTTKATTTLLDLVIGFGAIALAINTAIGFSELATAIELILGPRRP